MFHPHAGRCLWAWRRRGQDAELAHNKGRIMARIQPPPAHHHVQPADGPAAAAAAVAATAGQGLGWAMERCRAAERAAPSPRRAASGLRGPLPHAPAMAGGEGRAEAERSARDRARRALFSDATVPRRQTAAARAAAAAARAPGLQLQPHAFGAVAPAALRAAAERMCAVYGGLGACCWDVVFGEEAPEAARSVKRVLGLDGPPQAARVP